MQKLFTLLYKGARKAGMLVSDLWSQMVCTLLFYAQNVKWTSFRSYGLPYVSVAQGGECIVGRNLTLNNSLRSNPVGRSQPCVLVVAQRARLLIGNNVGLSQAALICHTSITIGDNVMIGAGACIYDTDFHSLDPAVRQNVSLDMQVKAKKPVVIKDNAFIGAHSTILKGVTIGRNAVIGSCSVVTKDVPDNEIWAGNPARFVKALFEKQQILETVL